MNAMFCGHRDIAFYPDAECAVDTCLMAAIEAGADRFLCGGDGFFDILCAERIRKFKKKFPHIKLVLVLPYLDRKTDAEEYDEIIYPPIEKTPRRFAIVARNRWMLAESKIVISGVRHSFGNAAKIERIAFCRGIRVLKVFS